VRRTGTLAAGAALLVGVVAAPADAAKLKLRTEIAVPAPGDATLLRSDLALSKLPGRPLPRRIVVRLSEGERGAPPGVRVVGLAVRTDRRNARQARYTLLAAALRSASGASARAAQDEDASLDLLLQFVTAGVYWGSDDRPRYEEALRRAREQTLNAFAGSERADGCEGVESALRRLSRAISVAQGGFTTLDNLRYAFGAGCALAAFSPPGAWFEANGLAPPGRRHVTLGDGPDVPRSRYDIRAADLVWGQDITFTIRTWRGWDDSSLPGSPGNPAFMCGYVYLPGRNPAGFANYQVCGFYNPVTGRLEASVFDVDRRENVASAAVDRPSRDTISYTFPAAAIRSPSIIHWRVAARAGRGRDHFDAAPNRIRRLPRLPLLTQELR
jgi:hypothetical protein